MGDAPALDGIPDEVPGLEFGSGVEDSLGSHYFSMGKSYDSASCPFWDDHPGGGAKEFPHH